MATRQTRSMRRQHAGETVTVQKPSAPKTAKTSASEEEDSELAVIQNASRASWKAIWDAQTVARSRSKVAVYETRAKDRASASKSASDDKRAAGAAKTAQRIYEQKLKTLQAREKNLASALAAVPREEQAFVREVVTAIDNHFRRTYS